MSGAKSRRNFLLSIGGGTAALLFLDACGGENVLSSPPQSFSSAVNNSLDTSAFEKLMRHQNFAAITLDSATVIRDDFKANAALLRHLALP
jgi:hypothetical protein